MRRSTALLGWPWIRLATSTSPTRATDAFGRCRAGRSQRSPGMELTDSRRRRARRRRISLSARGRGRGFGWQPVSSPTQATDRIRKVSGGTITTVAGNGSCRILWRRRARHQRIAHASGGVAVDSAGNIYIADTVNDRIRKVSGGTITTVAGNGSIGFSGDGGPATSASLRAPTGVAVDSAGNLYIADTCNHRIRRCLAGRSRRSPEMERPGSLATEGPPPAHPSIVRPALP